LIQKFNALPDYKKALRIASIACQTPDQLPGITNAATQFTRKSEQPYWAKDQQPVAIIGRHAFFKLDRY
jgi:hypothetical protein